jgi:hypothetical protein
MYISIIITLLDHKFTLPTHLTIDQGRKGKNPSNALQAASRSDHNELYNNDGDDGDGDDV